MLDSEAISKFNPFATCNVVVQNVWELSIKMAKRWVLSQRENLGANGGMVEGVGVDWVFNCGQT